MINVLPEEGKRWLRTDYRLRLVSAALLCVSFLSFVSTAFLLPSYLLSREQHGEAEAQRAAFAQALASDERAEAAASLARSRAMLAAYEARVKFPVPSPYIASIVGARGSGVSIEDLSYQTLQDGQVQVRVGGTAKSRDSLIAFSRTLERVPGVRAVDLPVSNLTRSTDVAYALTVIFLPEK